MALLEVEGLVKFYGRRKVVAGVSFTVDRGEVVGLLGPNGAGKTTSFRMTTGQIEPNDGAVTFDGTDVTQLPMYQRARRGMGYLSQEVSVFRKLTVEQNVLAILEALPKSRSLGRKLTRSERWDRTEAVLTQFGLLHVRKNNAWRCSGGEKRRLEIARCLVCEPSLILLDEPFAAVDPITKDDMRKIIDGLAKQGIGILITDHDVRDVLKSTHRSYLIKDGAVLMHGTPQEIIHSPLAIQSYLGNAFEDWGLGLHQTAPAAVVGAAPEPEIRRLVDGLTANETLPLATAELVKRGRSAVPALLEAMGRDVPELRRRAFLVLNHLCGPAGEFDPQADADTRSRQLRLLRDRLLKASAA